MSLVYSSVATDKVNTSVGQSSSWHNTRSQNRNQFLHSFRSNQFETSDLVIVSRGFIALVEAELYFFHICNFDIFDLIQTD